MTAGPLTGLAGIDPREIRVLRWLLGLNALLLIAGLAMPVITLSKFVVIETDFSVLGGLAELWRQGQWLLLLVIGGFSVLLPWFKLVVLQRILAGGGVLPDHLTRSLTWMHRFGRWSMLDVFVVAVLVVAVKLDAIASVALRPGLYAFAGAVLLTMVITARVVALSERRPPGGGADRHQGPEAG